MIKFTKPRVHSPEHEGIEKYQKEGLSEAQNECGFGMIPGSGLRDGQVSSWVLDGIPGFKLSTLENYP